MTKHTSTQLKLDKAILFVNHDKNTCLSALRIAEFQGLHLQIASSVNSALSFLEHKSKDYFLVFVDEGSLCPDGSLFVAVLGQRWPHLRLVLASDEAAPCSKSLNAFIRLSKPYTDKELSDLFAFAREDFLKRSYCFQKIIDDRLAILKTSIEEVSSLQAYREMLVDLAAEYLAVCQKGWRQSGRYSSEVFTQDSEQFQQFLSHRIVEAIKKICARNGGQEPASNFYLSDLLEQFDISSDMTCDRYIHADEAGLVSIFAILKDYYTILGYDLKSVVYPQSTSIKFDLGGRFTYNDLFNPLLSSVQKGVELACLQLEFFMLARMSNIDVDISYDSSYSLSLIW